MGQTGQMSVAEARPLTQSRKSVAKRDAIVRAAIDIINAKSFALATMTEIAASLDLRDATLYYYFPNKQALAYECHLRSLDRFERFLDQSRTHGGTGLEKLRRFLHDLLEDSDRNGPSLYFGDHSYLEPEQREAINAFGARLRLKLERFLKDGVADGSIVRCETALVVQLLIGMLIWLGRWTANVEKLTVDRLMKAIDAFAFHGLAADS